MDVAKCLRTPTTRGYGVGANHYQGENMGSENQQSADTRPAGHDEATAGKDELLHQEPAAGYPLAPYTPHTPALGLPGGAGPVGTIRSTGTCMLLTLVTLGFYPLFWYFKTHEEMKRHTNAGLGGGVALLLSVFVGIVMPFITASEVGGLYERRGHRAPVGGVTGLWMLLPVLGIIIWFVKVNGALNAYWRSLGAR